jgi:DMSO/TMAO reductase YedYZ molybdopterin-dependent catalytic subunit
MSKPLSKTIKNILTRMIAVAIATGLATIGAGSMLGVDVWKSAGLAAILGCTLVARSLASAYLSDGELTQADIDKAFLKVDPAGHEEVLCAPESPADTHDGIK